jgi:hypothetical protein
VRPFLFTISLTALVWANVAGADDAPPADPLVEGFQNPPPSARPRVWWHWLNGNVTEDGITRDLEWMHRVGIGGVQAFDASLGTPQIVPDRLAYMSPAWKHAFAHAADIADRLGLELAVASSPGWSETGGPWVKPADAMKKLVWRETDIVGGKPVSLRLPLLPDVSGTYGSAAFFDPLAMFEGKGGAAKPAAAGDVAVFAYPVVTPQGAAPRATDQAGAALDVRALSDDREDTNVSIPRGATPAILLDYPAAQTVRSATLYLPNAVPPFGDPEFLPALEAETEQGWTPVANLPLANVPTTVAFAPIVAKRFRVVFAPNTLPKRASLAAPAPGAEVGGIFPGGPAATSIAVGTLKLSPEVRVNRFEAKAGFATVLDFYKIAGTAPEEPVPDAGRVIDLTPRVRADGTLAWTPPAGRWRVVRLGWSLLGTTNHPAAPDATGLEVDKYDGAAVRRYLTTYLDTYRDAMGPNGKGIDALLTDSIESGDANWTPRLFERFQALRGYDPRPWLPVLTGAVIGSRTKSDAFLYDYRRTLADLIASEHYGTVAAVAHERGLKHYGEALEDARPQLGDDMMMRAHTDVPMAAMWAFGKDAAPRPTLIGDVLGAASVAHVYGQNLVAAESFTAAFSPWAFAPADLRQVADLEFALGVNRPVIHTSVHSPMEDKEPGLSLAIFGQYFNRHETWAEMARPWIDYLARSSFLLQQGRHVADVAYFYGEEAPLTALYAEAPLADVPTGRGFDFVNADVLANQLDVVDGALVAKSGAHYRTLYLGGSSNHMTLATLSRIAALAAAGATVIGEAPSSSPSLDDDRAAYAALVARLWGGGAETHVGKGRMIRSHELDAAMARDGTVPDFTYDGQTRADILFQHRATQGADIYFVSNRTNHEMRIDGRFRVAGRAAELWHADTGQSEPISYRAVGSQTIVPLTLPPNESAFVLFRHAARGTDVRVAPAIVRAIATVKAPWQITFQPGRGAPASITLPALAPLQAQSDPGVKYFSGVTTYRSRVSLPGAANGTRLMLDLGRVGDVAEVRVNGQLVGTVWHAPYRVDMTSAARRGDNDVEVRVANLWVNRLIGDAQPGAVKHTFVVAPTYRPDAPLRPSGLIGPVTVQAESGGAANAKQRRDAASEEGEK